MFKRSRSAGFKVVTAGTAFVIFSLFVVLIYSSGRQHGEAIGENAANSDTYASHAEKEIEQCLALLNDGTKAKCIRGVVEASNEHERAERDLVAQTEMALWALGVLIVSGAMAIVTALGVWFVWRTLIATQDMARDTREIGEAQVRAYLQCSQVTCKPLRQNATDDMFSLTVKIKNMGQSPAMRMQLSVGIEILDYPDEQAGTPIQVNPDIGNAMPPQGEAAVVLSFGYAKGAAESVRSSKSYFRFTVTMAYKDVFGKQFDEVSCHYTEGSLLDSGVTGSHIKSMKPEHRPK